KESPCRKQHGLSLLSHLEEDLVSRFQGATASIDCRLWNRPNLVLTGLEDPVFNQESICRRSEGHLASLGINRTVGWPTLECSIHDLRQATPSAQVTAPSTFSSQFDAEFTSDQFT